MNGLQSQQKQIGDHLYEVTQLNAIKGTKVFTRFAKLVAPIVGELADGANDKAAKVDEEKLKAKWAKAISSLMSSIGEDDLSFFCDAFAATTCLVVEDADGKTRRPPLKDTFGIHFASKYDELLGWLYFCLEVNFGSFFAAAGLRRATAEVPAASS